MSKLLSQGGFGCVYYPGITCKGEKNKDKKMVTKIQKDDFTAQNEIYIGEKIKSISNYNLFFLPVISSCSINLAQIKSSSLIECEVISKKHEFEYILMDIPFMPNKSFFSFLIDYDKTKKHIILDMTETYSYLLNSIQDLVQKEIIHFDLKAENILYSTSANNPLIIDFGISIPVEKLQTDNLSDYFYIFAPDYYIWPLEVHIINYLIHQNSQPLNVDDVNFICNEFVNKNKALSIFSKSFQDAYLKSCKTACKSYLGKSMEDIISIVKTSYNTWDNYALSVLYLRLLAIMFGKGFVNNKLLIYFSQLLLENISPFPHKRYSLKKTLTKFREIFFIDEKPKNYIELIDNFYYDKDFLTQKIKEDLDSLPKLRRNLMKNKKAK
jgi:serine/threonine protein kinase